MKAQRLGMLMVVCLLLVPVTAWAQAATSGRSVWDSVYTSAQAEAP